MPKILVADDNANIQKMVVLAFDERGIEVITVGNGEAAVRRIPDLNPDLILADIFMPVRNGYEVCEFVKKDQRFSHIPVILLVGAFDPLDEKEARRVGADGVLKKPFVPPDPLIAMVMSALEKNPKVVAELAKAKEAKEAKEVLPPAPEPMLEIPSRPEPKPLPEFPEPTPEEAAMVYGFGKGVRALDDEQAASVSKAPVAEAEEEEEADFDGSSTATDWRRDAMSFEVPSESANTPAFSSNEDLEQVTFPSESEYPPKRVRVQEAEADEETSALANVETPVFMDADEAAAAFIDQSAEPEVAAELPREVASETQEASAPEPEPERAPEPVSKTKFEEPAAAQDVPSTDTPHWMDALAPFEGRQAGGGWMTALPQPSPQTAFTESHSQVAEVAVAQSHEQEFAPQNRDDEFASSVVPSLSTVESVEAHADASTEAIAIVEEPEASTPPPSVSEEEPSFTSESAVNLNEPAVNKAEESWFAPAPPVFERIYDTVSAPVAVAVCAPDQGLEVSSSDDAPSLSFKDPGLVEPAAVRVTPEPLLIDDNETHGPSDYGVHAQQLTPLHSFFAPSSGDPVAEEQVSAHDKTAPPSFELDSSSNGTSERIATVPPPNREALSEIPFLIPPADFQQSESRDTTKGHDAVDVDEVVRRVLEKLQPQLHDLLSQGVLKPLIENLLQSELAKKDR